MADEEQQNGEQTPEDTDAPEAPEAGTDDPAPEQQVPEADEGPHRRAAPRGR